MNRTDQIKARLEIARAEQPYEVVDRHEIASQAWSDLYQYAPSDIDYLLRQLDTRSHDLRIAEATADDRLREIQRLHGVLEEVGKELKVESTHRGDAECAVCTHLQHVDVYDENEVLRAKIDRVEALLDESALLGATDAHGVPHVYGVTLADLRTALDGGA